MFVRFRKRPLNIWADTCLEAILVQNRRDGMKVRQECVKYLGSIRLSRIKSLYRQTLFWRKVRGALDTLALLPNCRESIEEKILRHVPMPEEMRKQGKYKAPHGFREKMKLTSGRLKRGG